MATRLLAKMLAKGVFRECFLTNIHKAFKIIFVVCYVMIHVCLCCAIIAYTAGFTSMYKYNIQAKIWL